MNYREVSKTWFVGTYVRMVEQTPQMAAASLCPKDKASCLLTLLKFLQDQQVGLT